MSLPVLTGSFVGGIPAAVNNEIQPSVRTLGSVPGDSGSLLLLIMVSKG